MIDYKAADFWLRVAQVVGYILLGIWVYVSNRQKATVDEIVAVRKALAAHEEAQAKNCGAHHSRTTTLEVTVQKSPTHHDLGLVYERINGVGSAVDKLSGLVKGMNTNLVILIEHHTKGGK